MYNSWEVPGIVRIAARKRFASPASHTTSPYPSAPTTLWHDARAQTFARAVNLLVVHEPRPCRQHRKLPGKRAAYPVLKRSRLRVQRPQEEDRLLVALLKPREIARAQPTDDLRPCGYRRVMRSEAKMPYFALWIEDPELMVAADRPRNNIGLLIRWLCLFLPRS